MHTCEKCMFCHYRQLRIAAFAARDAGPSGRQPDTGPGQPVAPAPGQPMLSPPDAGLATPEGARVAAMV